MACGSHCCSLSSHHDGKEPRFCLSTATCWSVNSKFNGRLQREISSSSWSQHATFLFLFLEHVCSILASLLRNLRGQQRTRLLNKFTENDSEKVSAECVSFSGLPGWEGSCSGCLVRSLSYEKSSSYLPAETSAVTDLCSLIHIVSTNWKTGHLVHGLHIPCALVFWCPCMWW